MLSEVERGELPRLVRAGTAPARQRAHARILFKAGQRPEGPAWVDTAIADALEVSQPTISRIRKQYVEQGPAAALNCRMPRRPYPRQRDGAQETR